MKKIDKYIFIYITIFFLLQLYLNFCYPLTSDSLLFKHAVHVENGKELFEYVLKFGNGRFLGNLGGIVMSKIEWLNIIWSSICLAGVFFLLIDYLDTKKKSVIILLGGLLLFPSVKMYAQVYVWIAGFLFIEKYILVESNIYILFSVLALSFGLVLISTEWKYCDETRIKYFERKIAEEPRITSIDFPRMPNERLLQADFDTVYWRYVVRDYWGMEPEEPVDIVINWYTWYNWLNIKDDPTK